MRREILKSYLLALLAEGQLAGSKSVAELLTRASASFAEDTAAVGQEILAMVMAQQVRRLGEATISAMEKAVSRAAGRGFKNIWQDIKAAYGRGVRRKERY